MGVSLGIQFLFNQVLLSSLALSSLLLAFLSYIFTSCSCMRTEDSSIISDTVRKTLSEIIKNDLELSGMHGISEVLVLDILE